MPLYDYECLTCHKNFTLVLMIKEHEAGKLACPACGSPEIKQLIRPFFAKTDSKT